jgi:Family of unknown function (DUF5677)
MSTAESDAALRAKVERAEHDIAELSSVDLVGPDDDFHRSLIVLGTRSRRLFLGFRHAVAGPEPIAALALVRPLVEINLLLRFFLVNQELHPRLWIAESERLSLALVNEFESDPAMLERHGLSGFPPEVTREREEYIQAVRAEGVAAGIPGIQRGSVLPPLPEIVRIVDDAAAREAYTLAYRGTSDHVHAGARAFRGYFLKDDASGQVSFVEELGPEDYLATRALVVSTLASTLCLLSGPLDRGVFQTASEIKRRFVRE